MEPHFFLFLRSCSIPNRVEKLQKKDEPMPSILRQIHIQTHSLILKSPLSLITQQTGTLNIISDFRTDICVCVGPALPPQKQR